MIENIVVYTVIFGDGYSLPPFVPAEGVDHICFTDQNDLEARNWQILRVAPMLPDDLPRSSREQKIRAHRWLSGYDASIYIDPSVVLTKSATEIWNKMVPDREIFFGCFRHSFRSSLTEEFEAVQQQQLDTPTVIAELHSTIRRHNLELFQQKPFWGGLIARRHNDPRCIEVMELWHSLVLRYSRRDQLSLPVALAASEARQIFSLEQDIQQSSFHHWPRAGYRRPLRYYRGFLPYSEYRLPFSDGKEPNDPKRTAEIVSSSNLFKRGALRCAFHREGSPRRWLRRLLMQDKAGGQVRAPFRRIVFKKRGTPRQLFSHWTELSDPQNFKMNEELAMEDWRRTLDNHLLSSNSAALKFLREKGRTQLHPIAYLATEAILIAREQGFAASLKNFRALADYHEKIGRIDFPESLTSESKPSRQGPIAEPIKYQAIAEKVVVYTALFEPNQCLHPILTEHQNLNFICFTDQDIAARGWITMRHPPPFEDKDLSSLYFKILAHELFPDREASLYIDPNTLLMGRLEAMIGRWLAHHDIVMWRHPERSDIGAEAEQMILQQHDRPDIICEQMMNYLASGTPRAAGLYDTSFIWRRHDSLAVRKLMEAWWCEIRKFSKCDRISLYHLVHGRRKRPKVLPGALGTAQNNIWSSRTAARRYSVDTPKTMMSKPRIVFLYDEEAKNYGSAAMRVFQLADILQSRLGNFIQVETASSLQNPKNSLVIVSKQMIDRLNCSDLIKLRRKNVAIAADPVDGKIAPEKIPLFDFIVAASLGAYRHLCESSSGPPVFLLTHHADTRIGRFSLPNDRARIGYFGLLGNTMGTNQLDNIVDYNPIDTTVQNTRWINLLAQYNAHFALRQARNIDGFKPFTKGFVAAKCGAIIICERNVGDNSYYLGDDYPYYVPSTEIDEVERFLLEVRGSFGTPTWMHALEIMESVRRRSSEDWIAREFTEITNAVFT